MLRQFPVGAMTLMTSDHRYSTVIVPISGVMETRSAKNTVSSVKTSTSYTMRELRELARKDNAVQRRQVIEEKAQLIREIEKRRSLWDRNLNAYRQKEFVDSLWDEVAAILQKDKQQCKRLWKNLVDHFREILSTLHITSVNDDGFAEVPSITWPYFEPMLFMKNFLESRNDESDCTSSGLAPENLLELSYTDVIVVEESKQEGIQEVGEVLLDDSENANSSLTTEPSEESSEPQVESALPDVVASEKPPKTKTRQVRRPRGVKRPRRATNENLAQELKEVNRELKVLPPPRSAAFSDYLMEVLGDVPDDRRRQCEHVLLQVVNAFADGNAVVVAVQPIVQ